MNLQSNDFELFGIPRQFAQDRAALDARWKALQREAHPDKFTTQGEKQEEVEVEVEERRDRRNRTSFLPFSASFVPLICLSSHRW